MIKKYKLIKDIEVEVLQFNGENYMECSNFIKTKNMDLTLNYPNVITPNGVMEVKKNNFVIKVSEKEFYTCKLDVFEFLVSINIFLKK